MAVRMASLSGAVVVGSSPAEFKAPIQQEVER